MNRIFHRLLILSLCALNLSLVPGCQKHDIETTAEFATTTTTAPEPTDIENYTDDRAVAAYEAENRAQLQQADQHVALNRKRAAALARRKDFRTQLQLNLNGVWSDFISTNTQAFLRLRGEAVHAHDHTAACTICDGRGHLTFCFLCNHTGKCKTCGGTGKLNGGDICPTCVGNGKCFLCFGTGSMVCPFCDDGSVYANQPDPPRGIPIR